MSLAVHLLGRPRLEGSSSECYQFRSRKSWALLAYLLLAERPQTRAHLASLLFASADDPVRALRWCLSEVRRGLGDGALIDGDPVVLRLEPGTVVDVHVLTQGPWADGIVLPGLGAELLEGIALRDAAAFETWLLAEQRRTAALSEAVLHEAALGSMSRGDLRVAVGYAARAAAMSPSDEDHQTLLIRLYRMAGDAEAAARQHTAATQHLRQVLGVEPGAALTAALAVPLEVAGEPVADGTIEAVLEAGTAAIAAGAVPAGVQSLRTAARLADRADIAELRVTTRLALGEALVHSLGGHDEDGIASLYEADAIALEHGLLHASVQARTELGYVDFLRGRYFRAELWLRDVLRHCAGQPAVAAKALGYLGSVESDLGNHAGACVVLDKALATARLAGDAHREAYVLAMLGRAALFLGELEQAADHLDRAVAVATADHWLWFLPWPQALRGEVQLARGDAAGAEVLLQQAFARACQLGDPCWEGMAARGLALVAEARGEPEQAFRMLADAQRRCTRLTDTYMWLEAYILDAQCELGLRHGHPGTASWVAALRELTSRTGMRDLAGRSLQHGAALAGAVDTTPVVALDLARPRRPDTLGRASRSTAGRRSPVV